MARYVLSTGEVTEKPERYVQDLFRMCISIYPNDIPNSSFGFNFILGDIKKDEFTVAVTERAGELVRKVNDFIPNEVSLKLDSVDVINYEKVRIYVNIYGNSEETVSFDVDINTAI